MSIDKGKYNHVVCVYNEILLSHKKKNEITPFAATWMDLEIIKLRELSKTERQISHISLICGI